MAHLISVPPPNYLDSDCLIKIPCKEVVTSLSASKLRRKDEDMYHENTAEEDLIIRMCKKLSEKEFLKIQRDNEILLNRNFQKLKRRMRSSVKSKENMVSKFFDSKDANEPRLSTLLKNYPQRIDIAHKHHMKIESKLGCLREAQQIQGSKEKYQNWLNNSNNSPIKSPNYAKMNYVLEKVNDKKQLSSILKPLRFSHNQKHSWCRSISKVSHTDYSPKKSFPHSRDKVHASRETQ